MACSPKRSCLGLQVGVYDLLGVEYAPIAIEGIPRFLGGRSGTEQSVHLFLKGEKLAATSLKNQYFPKTCEECSQPRQVLPNQNDCGGGYMAGVLLFSLSKSPERFSSKAE